MSCIVVACPIHFSEAVEEAWLDPNTDRESEHHRKTLSASCCTNTLHVKCPRFFFRYEILSSIQTDNAVI